MEDERPAKPVQKLWYEALSPEGYTYYWHIESNGEYILYPCMYVYQFRNFFYFFISLFPSFSSFLLFAYFSASVNYSSLGIHFIR